MGAASSNPAAIGSFGFSSKAFMVENVNFSIKKLRLLTDTGNVIAPATNKFARKSRQVVHHLIVTNDRRSILELFFVFVEERVYILYPNMAL